MSCSSQYSLSFFLLLSLFFTLSSSHSHSITLSLSTPKKQNLSSATTKTLRQQLRQMSLARSSANISSTTPLFADPNGVDTITLSFGTPPQSLDFILSTSAVINSMPCGTDFSCDYDCTLDPKDIPTFNANLSNSSALVYCNDTLLQDIVPYEILADECTLANASCLAHYTDDEGSLVMSGVILSESLTLPGVTEKAHNLLVGCASDSFGWPQGIGVAAFGRASSSLASQLKITKFSHCFVSELYQHNHNVSGSLVLTWGGDDDEEEEEVSDAEGTQNIMHYTPFINNTAYYYLSVEMILVGGVVVEVPKEYLTPDDDGNGGLKMETGYTFSIMDVHVFEPFVKEFEKQVGTNYSRATEVENELFSDGPCYHVGDSGMKGLPELVFRFPGEAELVVPRENLFASFNESVICMTIWLDGDSETDQMDGPAITLGLWQMQNVYVEYDLANNRLGFQHKNCSQVSY
ncbi:eukaryotic aspartyl protease family protein [Striga asiatica]|uniref:Eukaryotic aspartyl protease family protein n=1 Tax=Striga asiatica TaxID=4170 RepID=A0A5A7QA89_STRAF|nr:eukaryotic aspartyl protease family protein [Striga asiatica]